MELAGGQDTMGKFYRRKVAVADVDSDIEIGLSEEENRQMEIQEGEPVAAREDAQLVKALISRMADLEHYNAINDIDFIIDAIGRKDYAGSPALDVLPSHDGIDHERREEIKEYIHALTCWADGKDIEDAIAEFKSSEKLLRNIYINLGDLDEEKKDLALVLSQLLKEKSASPEDTISEIPDEEFIAHVYKTILDREPDADDVKFRLTQLSRGRTRQELISDILESKESSRRMLTIIAESIDVDSTS